MILLYTGRMDDTRLLPHSLARRNRRQYQTFEFPHLPFTVSKVKTEFRVFPKSR